LLELAPLAIKKAHVVDATCQSALLREQLGCFVVQRVD
jgi:hypothetical protein